MPTVARRRHPLVEDGGQHSTAVATKKREGLGRRSADAQKKEKHSELLLPEEGQDIDKGSAHVLGSTNNWS